MNVKLYAAGELVYDNFLPDEQRHDILSLSIDDTVNKGGVAKIIIPHGHPAYDSFPAFSIPVEVYRDGKLRWRGRPIPPTSEDICMTRTIVCEGELCFLQDAILRPYTFTGTVKEVFAQILAAYNAVVEPWKRFNVGYVEVDGNVELTAKKAENALEALQKLIKLCAGYVFFSTAEDGSRCINLYKQFPYTCNQSVSYGQNLADFSRQTGGGDFATRLIPFGAADENGNPIKIDRDGLDYVENAAAIAQYGVIEKAVTYSDVTDPVDLQFLAEADVAALGLMPATIQLSAIDMSKQDLSLDAFAVGQQVSAESSLHKMDGVYFVTGLSEDLINPKVGGIVLQRELASISSNAPKTLTGAISVSRKGLVSDANSYSDQTVAGISQKYIFDKLTNYGAVKGCTW